MAANRITIAQWHRLAGKAKKPVTPKPAAKKQRKPTPFVAPDWTLADSDLSRWDAVEIEIPIRLVTLENQREHWSVKARRAKEQRGETRRIVDRGTRETKWSAPAPIRITLTRLAPRKLDSGNFHGSFKHVQDGVADWLHIDDGSPDLEWVYAQEKSECYGVRVRMESTMGERVA